MERALWIVTSSSCAGKFHYSYRKGQIMDAKRFGVICRSQRSQFRFPNIRRWHMRKLLMKASGTARLFGHASSRADKSCAWRRVAAIAGLVVLGMTVTSAGAQTDAVKEKPRLYRFESYWTFPPTHWGDVDKDNATSSQKALAPALADGTLLGYGDDENLVRSREAYTHSNWWLANSTADVLKVLDAFEKGGASSSSRLIGSTQHWTQKYYSPFYNWKAGSWKGAYGKRWVFMLRRGIDPDDAMRALASFYVPLFESLLADGTIVEYEIDREEVFGYSADSAGQVLMSYVTPTADGSAKVGKAFTAAYEKSPPMFALIALAKAGAFTNDDALLTETVRVNAIYK